MASGWRFHTWNSSSCNEFEAWQQEALSERQSVPMLREEAPAAAEGVAIPKIVILDWILDRGCTLVRQVPLEKPILP
jgi:hypothetical protein